MQERWQAAASDVVRTWEVYARLFAASGVTEAAVRRVAEGCLDALHRWAPDLAEEVQATATAAGLATWQGAALTARTEVLSAAGVAHAGECSSLVRVRRGQPPVGAQTWDWHPELADCWTVRRGSGEVPFVTLTEFGIPAKIGVNAAGVGVLLNILGHRSDGTRPGVPVHALARRVLDTATDVGHAVSLLGSATVGASSCLTVLDAESAAAVEVSPAGLAVLGPRDGAVVHTNHFEDETLAEGDVRGPLEPDTYDRARLVRARVAEAARAQAREDLVGVLCAHEADGAPVCCHPEEESPSGAAWKTLATILIEPATSTLGVHAGGPCEVTSDGWRRWTT